MTRAPMPSSRSVEADLCIVGAGIVGLAHALEARRRGLTVALVDRAERAVGASVRNFGHGCVAAMGDGPALDCALEARERWRDLTARSGLPFWTEGTVVIARHADELVVLEEIAGDPRRDSAMLTTRQLATLVDVPLDGVVGALHARSDFRVDPRASADGLARLLEPDPGATVLWSHPVNEVASGSVEAGRMTITAPQIILCPGPDFGVLPPHLQPQRDGLQLCKLQMLRARDPRGRRFGPALMTGLSLLRYPAYTAAAGHDAVRARLTAERPELLEHGIHLIITQLPDGDLIIGDSHDYGITLTPFDDEQVDRLILDEAERLLGAPLRVTERWNGIYPVAPGEPFCVEEPLPGVHVVEVVAGIGMTTSLGLAPRVLDGILS